jgi:hemerythrin-like metal-binding protein
MARPRAPSQDHPGVVFDWTDGEGTTVGVEIIDAHHRHIARRVRQLATAVSDGRAEETRAALRFLHTYLAAHHEDEERWMSEGGYPGTREHIRSHAEILARIGSVRDAQPAATVQALAQTAEWVSHALEAHMRAEDIKLARFFTARENLRRLAESGLGYGAALTPLPGALAAVPVNAPAPAPGAPGSDSGSFTGSRRMSSEEAPHPVARSAPRTRK